MIRLTYRSTYFRDNADPLEVWSLLIYDEIIQVVVLWTNEKIKNKYLKKESSDYD